MTSLFSNDDCIKILENYLRTSDGFKLISSEFQAISGDVEGFMGEHNKLVITYEFEGAEKSQIFFVKSKPEKNKAQEEVADTLEVFKREIFVYEILIKEFEKYGFDTSFAAKSYHSIPNTALVMEDLTKNGFSVTERNVNLTIKQLKCCLNSLALFHAGGYALEQTKTKELNKQFVLGDVYEEYMNETFYVHYIDQTMYAMKWWDGCTKTLKVLLNLLPHDEAYRNEYEDLLNQAEIGKAFSPTFKTGINKTCGHGDLWSNNMLFKYENDEPVKCCLVDFQVNRYSYPAMDVLLSIYCNTDRKFRELHVDELYLYYHKTLSDTLQKYGYNIEKIHSLKDFYASIKLVKIEAIMQNLLTVILTLLGTDKLNEVSGDESGFQELFFDNDKLAAKAFQTDVAYRTKVSEVMYELREELLVRCKSN